MAARSQGRGSKGRNGLLPSRSPRKGMELPVTFLVVMIISIVIFASGLFLVRKFFQATTTFQEQIDVDTQREIERRLSESGEKVALPINRKVMRVGDTQVFGLGILNTRIPEAGPKGKCMIGGVSTPCTKFGVAVKFVTAIDKQTQKKLSQMKLPDGSPMPTPEVADVEANWIPSTYPPVELKPNELKVVSIPVNVDNIMKVSPSVPTRRGTIYIFNVCVFNDATKAAVNGPNCATAPTAFVTSGLLHGDKVLKMYVEVD